MWGAGHPQLVKVREPGELRGRAQGGSPTPLPSSLTSSSAPLPPRPLLSVPGPRAAAGAGPGTPLPPDCQSRRPGNAAGRRAAYLGPRCGDSRQASAGRGAAPSRLGVSSGSRFYRTPSGAQSSQTGPDCSRRSRRRRCRRQRTPRGGWKPV